jgi:soluble cytochrome b562
MSRSKKEKFEVPGTIVKCQSGRYMAFYEHRTDIVASGENERDAKKNLKKMYAIVKKHEDAEEEKKTVVLPKSYQTKTFKEKLPSI